MRSPSSNAMIQNNVVMIGLTNSMHFQQFEDFKFQFFSGGSCSRIPLMSIRLDLGEIVPILLENPES